MFYNAHKDGCFTVVASIGILSMIGAAIVEKLGWNWLFIIIISFGFLFLVEKLINNYKKRKEEKLRLKAPCSHGVVGALYDRGICQLCTQERIIWEEDNRKKKLEEENRKKVEREHAHREWVRKIRLPEYLKTMDPKEFEHLVCKLYKKIGYDVERTQYQGDNGIDGYLRKDGILSVLQCKRVQGAVGEPVLRDLFGTMHAIGAKEGVVVTTGKVSKQAQEWSKNKPIRIIELNKLVGLIRDNFNETDVVLDNFEVVDSGNGICPKCGSQLKIVKWKRKKFLGCTGYPDCRYTKSLRVTQKF